MIMGEKILTLRKKNGWSQEELAEKMNVSRQSISKWESATSVPDLNKILELSKLFGVSTDYLVKDDMETTEYVDSDETTAYKKISVQTAHDFINSTVTYSKQVARGTMLCILSPVLLIVLAGASDSKLWGITEDLAGGVGTVVLLCMIAAAVAIFIISSSRAEKYQYIRNGEFEREYGVDGVAKSISEKYSEKYTRNIVIGVVICIVSVCPLIIAGVLDLIDMVLISCVALLLILVSFAVYLFITSGMMKDCLDNLMFEGDYTRKNIEINKKSEKFGEIFWPAIVAVYLLVSFLTDRWDISWLIWPVAALLFASISAIIKKD